MKKAFTLIEVNLAVGVMTVGVLSILGLFMFGYRETAQGREDIEAAALADHVMAPLVAAISHTNMPWSVFRDGYQFPSEMGWGAYFNGQGKVTQDPESQAESVFNQVVSKMSGAAVGTFDAPKFPSSAKPTKPKMSCGLVVMHQQDSAVVSIGFRAVESDRPGTLLSMPLFFTEARFQGLANQ